MSTKRNKQAATDGCAAVTGSVSRLVGCCRVLGPWLGFRYWRLQNRAIRNPNIVIEWCQAWENGAKEADAKGDYLFAYCLRGMIRECEEIRRRHYTPNS